jgi:hypothetical protein
MSEQNYETLPLDHQLADQIDELIENPGKGMDLMSDEPKLEALMKTAHSLKKLGDDYPGVSRDMTSRAVEIKQAYRESFKQESRSAFSGISFSLTTATAMIGMLVVVLMIVALVYGGDVGDGIMATATSPMFIVSGLAILTALVTAVAYFLRKK